MRWLALFLLFSSHLSWSQAEDKNHRRHQLGLNQGIVYLPKTIVEENGEEEKVPSFVNYLGLTYKYRFNHKWNLTFETVQELARYVIDDDGEILARDNAEVVAVMGGYEIAPDVSIIVGGGYEFERNRNLPVIRGGVEADLFIANNWWIAPEFIFEWKQVYYNVSFGFKIMKGFGKVMDEPHE